LIKSEPSVAEWPNHPPRPQRGPDERGACGDAGPGFAWVAQGGQTAAVLGRPTRPNRTEIGIQIAACRDREQRRWSITLISSTSAKISADQAVRSRRRCEEKGRGPPPQGNSAYSGTRRRALRHSRRHDRRERSATAPTRPGAASSQLIVLGTGELSIQRRTLEGPRSYRLPEKRSAAGGVTTFIFQHAQRRGLSPIWRYPEAAPRSAPRPRLQALETVSGRLGYLHAKARLKLGE